MTAPFSETESEKMSTGKNSISSTASHSDSPKEAVTTTTASTAEKISNNVDIEKQAVKQQNQSNSPSPDLPAKDPNVVDFDGPDDPEHPWNWSTRKKWSMVAPLSLMTLATPLASSMFAPGVLQVLHDFHSSSEIYEAFVVSIYVLGFAAGPMILCPLSEMYGRTIIYHFCNFFFVAFTIACAVSTSLPMLTGFRFLAGFVGSAPVSIGGGSMADMFRQEERGRAIAIWSMGPLLGPVVGPIAGGFLAQGAGWRWVFWLVTIFAGLLSISYFFLVHETYSLIILQRKAKRLRQETGNEALHAKGDSGERFLPLFQKSIVRPLKLLFFSPIVLSLSLYAAICYGYLYLFFTTLPQVFVGTYHFTAGTVGLTYLGIGIGMFIGMAINGALSDKILKRRAAKSDGVLKPEYRMPLMIPGAIILPAGLFIYGWTADKGVQWIVPIIGTALFGFALISTMMPISQYLVDAFTYHAASAIAANAILRSIVGGLLPLAGPAMFSKLGVGWGNSLLGFVSVALMGIPLLLIKYGEALRTNPRFQVKL